MRVKKYPKATALIQRAQVSFNHMFRKPRWAFPNFKEQNIIRYGEIFVYPNAFQNATSNSLHVMQCAYLTKVYLDAYFYTVKLFGKEFWFGFGPGGRCGEGNS